MKRDEERRQRDSRRRSRSRASFDEKGKGSSGAGADGDDDYCILQTAPPTVAPSSWDRIKTLVAQKRWIYAKRDKKSMFLGGVMPLIFVAVSIAWSGFKNLDQTTDESFDTHAVDLSPGTVGLEQDVDSASGLRPSGSATVVPFAPADADFDLEPELMPNPLNRSRMDFFRG